MLKEKTFTIVRNVLVLIAVINLILLFGFHYEIPKFIQRHFKTEQEDLYINTNEKDTPDLNINFEEKVLTYDGSGKLDLNQGVTLTDKHGNPVNADIYSSITEGSSPTEKIITYTAEDKDGNTIAVERALILENYTGPSIYLSTAPTVVMDTDLAHLTDFFKDTEFVEALDGYDKDITDSVTISYAVTNKTATELTVTFSVTNMFNDTASESLPIPMQLTKPIIVLTTNKLTLKTGDVFMAGDYIYCATNEEGEDLRGLVNVSQDVNTSTPGTYRVTYELTDTDRESATPMTLVVEVE